MPDNIDELLARAEQAIADLQGEFEAGNEQRMQHVAEIFSRHWQPLASREGAVKELRRINHDLKGEAGTFGYELLGHIAALFSEYLRETPAAAQREETVRDYVQALCATWEQRIRGDGGAAGAQLLNRLWKLTPKLAAERAA